MTEQHLARSLVQAGLVTGQQIQAAAQRRGNGVGIAQALVDMNVVSVDAILQIDPQAFNYVPGGGAPQSGAPQGNGALIAAPSGDMSSNGALHDEAQIAPLNGGASISPEEANIGLGHGAAVTLDNSGVRFQGEATGETDPIASATVIYCNELLKIAVSLGASDMHLEPREEGLLPRYRVDGHLRPGGLIPRDMQPSVISRFKVLGSLDISENRMPQDGRFRATIGGHTFDFRVSTLPSIYGEKIVMRLLDRTALVTDLRQLGFSDDTRAAFEEMLSRSHGIILVTGPTGSGKTTTLYAALSITRDETKNVVTVEDPVEYELPGVTQTNVKTEIGLNFATQLRAILRQDPDVILVGEIRDTETADVAISAALTGHLVLSTLHTNSAVGAITRLQDMDIQPFLIASSLAGVLAQRLVRMICRQCRELVPQDTPEYQTDLLRLRLPAGTPLFRGAGCEACNGTGMRGRMSITELLSVDTNVRRAIMEKADADTLCSIAVSAGMKTLWHDAIDKLTRGLTTPDEIARVLLGSQDEE